MSRLATVFTVLVLLPLGTAWAQTTSVTGTVRDAETNEPMPGATILIEGSTRGTTTDTDGAYELRSLSASTLTLIVRSVGYATLRQPLTLTAGETQRLDMTLEPSLLNLDQVVVTATRQAEAIQNVPASVSVIPARQIETRAHLYASEPLIGVPGVVVRDNGESAFTTARFRGVPNNHQNDNFIALVDGVPFVTGGDEVDLDALVPLTVVDRVEVVKGPTSALYGRGSIGGTVNYITQNAFGAPRLSASVMGGSYGYVRPSLTASIPLASNNQLLVHGFYEQKDGWRDASDRTLYSFFAKNQWLPTPTTNVALYVNYYNQEQQYANHLPVRADGSFIPLPGGETTNYQIDDTRDERDFFLTTLKVDQAVGSDLTLSGTAHYRFMDIRDFLGFEELFNEETQEFYWNGFDAPTSSRTYFVEPQATYQFGRGKAIAGLSYEFIDTFKDQSFWTGEFGFNPDTFEFLFYTQKLSAETGEFTNQDAWVTDQLLDSEYQSQILGAYVQVELDVTEAIGVTLGGRFDDFRREATYFATNEEEETQTIEDDNRRFSPKASLRFKLTPDLSTYVTYAQGFNPAFGPNFSFENRSTGLKPEIAQNYEVGLKGRALNQQLAFNLAAYQLTRQDLLLVIFSEGGGDTPQSINAGEQRSRGLEAEVQADLSALLPGLSLFSNYAYTNSEWIDFRFIPAFSDTELDISGNRVSLVPEHMLQAGLNHRSDRLDVGLWVTYTSDYFVDRLNTVELGGYAVANASFVYRPPVSGLEVQGTLLNLFDNEYYHYFGGNEGARTAFPGRPFEALVALRYSF
ncbi:MAG: TonB-dependent receptor [Bacteroidota bacterium]